MYYCNNSNICKQAITCFMYVIHSAANVSFYCVAFNTNVHLKESKILSKQFLLIELVINQSIFYTIVGNFYIFLVKKK